MQMTFFRAYTKKHSQQYASMKGIYMLNIGCHQPTEGGYIAMAGEALALDANTFQFFLRSPRGGRARLVDPADIEDFNTFAREHNLGPIVGYASYTMNLAAPDQKERDYARMIFAEDLAVMEETPHQLYAMHCGFADGASADEVMQNLIDGINSTLTPHQTTKIMLMTMAGRGSEICGSFESLKQVLDGIKLQDHVGVCFDACNVFDAGYDIVNDLDGVLKQFDKVIGLDRIGMVHLNDSRYGEGSHEERHATIGEGAIGFDPLAALTNAKAFEGKPFIIEEPHGTLDEYKKDIAKFRAAYQG